MAIFAPLLPHAKCPPLLRLVPFLNTPPTGNFFSRAPRHSTRYLISKLRLEIPPRFPDVSLSNYRSRHPLLLPELVPTWLG